MVVYLDVVSGVGPVLASAVWSTAMLERLDSSRDLVSLLFPLVSRIVISICTEENQKCFRRIATELFEP